MTEVAKILIQGFLQSYDSRSGGISILLVRTAVISDGRAIPLDANRGFSTALIGDGKAAAQLGMSLDEILMGIKNTLRPDEPVPPGNKASAARYWEPMIQAMATYGVCETPDHLSTVPLEIVLSTELITLTGDPQSTEPIILQDTDLTWLYGGFDTSM
ncbi:MAG: hypothetical protein FWD55_04610 [Propionibacteriaceae bacterium]|nr:hypothetical protein [Propionibacteriaceae bacterium]